MAFTVYHSNHLDSLQYMASYLIKKKPLSDPLLPEYFIIHSSGMNNWLKSTLAEEHDIFANTRLEFPINQIVTIIENLLTEEEKERTNLRVSRLTLSWAVFDVLNDSTLEDLEVLEKYLAIEGTVHSEIRKMGLAEEIAGLFDRYLAYRPEWFLAWQRNELLFGTEDEIWQQKIWQKIYKKIMPVYYLANIIHLLKALPDDRYDHKKIPKRLSIIGLSTLPPLFIELLHVLSKHIEIHLFFTNPSQFYWGDLTQYRNRNIPRIIFESNEQREDLLPFNFNDEVFVESSDDSEQWLAFHGNPLLASFGKIGRDFLYLLSQYDDINEIEAFSEPDTKGLLGLIQREVFNLSPVSNDGEKYIVNIEDTSLTFHSHYSERREVEGLYDQLLHAFNADSTLEPKDIIVMVSDIDRYRPMIEAVFGSPFSTNTKIPFTISDFTLGKNEPILDAFLLLISLSESDFAASELLTLLEIPEIAEKFLIEQDDRALIKKWIENTNIKFGIDEQHLSDLHVREDFTNTWLWGIKRLLLGYGFNDPIEVDEVRVFPYIQGGEAIVLGHLVDFIDALINLRTLLLESYQLEEWRKILPEIWSNFYVDNENTQPRLQYLESVWNGFIDEGIKVNPLQFVSVYLIQRHINEHLSSFRPESRFLTGSVNFCTFIPMRSIPFKLVCMLGMNQDSFPQSRQHPDYDLMQAHPKRGDRSSVNDERYLFLEAILSAKDKVYISYVGRNIRNNSEMFPSIFVNELQHYLDEIAVGENSESVTQQLLIQHPLSPFNPDLFIAGSPIQSFQKEWMPTRHTLDSNRYHPKVEKLINVTVKELIDTFKDPLKAFSLTYFGIDFQKNSEREFLDDETFALSQQSYLEIYQARLNLLEALFYNDISDDLLSHYAKHDLFNQYKAEGRLPKFAFAKLDWNGFVEPILELALAARAKNCQYNAQEPLSLEIDGIQLSGLVSGVNHVQQCSVFVGKWKLHRQFTTYISHVLNTLRLQQSVETIIFYLDGQKVGETRMKPMTVDEANYALTVLLQGYRENLISPYILVSEDLWRPTERKLIKKHEEFILQSREKYDANNVAEYLEKNEDFAKKIMNKFEEALIQQTKKSMLIGRFVDEVTEKMVLDNLYFYIKYIQLIEMTEQKKTKK